MGIEEEPLSHKGLSRDHSLSIFARNTIGPKDMSRDISILSAKGDDNDDH